MEPNRMRWAVLLVACSALVCHEAAAGCREGPAHAKGTVQEDDRDVYKVWFNGREPAWILVQGDGDSDLDLYVYDDDDNLVCRDDDATDRMLCTWTPHRTGMFKVEIRNLGTANAYNLMTN